MPGEWEEDDQHREGWPGEGGAMPPTSILSPGRNGKASQPDQGPACTSRTPCREPSSPHLWAAAVWGCGHREGGARTALEAGVCHSPPPVMRLLQTGVALPTGPVRPSPLSAGRKEGPLSQSMEAAQKSPSPEKRCSLGTPTQGFFLF